MPQDAALALALNLCPLVNQPLLISTYIQSVMGVVVDWILVLLPIPAVTKTIMDKKTRISIVGILILGAA
jgi:hypothetical protein